MGFFYFAYGSNMSETWLKWRAPSARAVGVGSMARHTLLWHKRSYDGSGKADCIYTGNQEQEVFGVVFEIDDEEKCWLDSAEGLGKGYEEKKAYIANTAGETWEAYVYVASKSHIEDLLSPYPWYKRFVVEGAKAHNLPSWYIANLEAVVATEDSDVKRAAKYSKFAC